MESIDWYVRQRRTPAKPTEYLEQWLKAFRPHGYATRDDSWGELEKILHIVYDRHIELKRNAAIRAGRNINE